MAGPAHIVDEEDDLLAGGPSPPRPPYSTSSSRVVPQGLKAGKASGIGGVPKSGPELQATKALAAMRTAAKVLAKPPPSMRSVAKAVPAMRKAVEAPLAMQKAAAPPAMRKAATAPLAKQAAVRVFAKRELQQTAGPAADPEGEEESGDPEFCEEVGVDELLAVFESFLFGAEHEAADSVARYNILNNFAAAAEWPAVFSTWGISGMRFPIFSGHCRQCNLRVTCRHLVRRLRHLDPHKFGPDMARDKARKEAEDRRKTAKAPREGVRQCRAG